MALNSKQLVLCIFLVSITTLTQVAANLPQAEIDGFLAEHNKARADVGNPPLKWNEKIAKYAQDYADKRAGDCAMEHSMGPYAENLSSGHGMTGADATKFWVTEKEFYKYATNKCEPEGCGHWLAVVWSKTTDLGCGISKCKDGQNYVICDYDPAWQDDERPYTKQ